jgi:hypothetical protein
MLKVVDFKNIFLGIQLVASQIADSQFAESN